MDSSQEPPPQSRPNSAQPTPPAVSDVQLENFERAGRSLLQPLIQIIRLQDLMALLMVAGTFFAAWRSSQVSQQILRTAYRPLCRCTQGQT